MHLASKWKTNMTKSNCCEKCWLEKVPFGVTTPCLTPDCPCHQPKYKHGKEQTMTGGLRIEPTQCATPYSPQGEESLSERFYKEMGQYCSDAFDEVADWWLEKIAQARADERREIVEKIENYPKIVLELHGGKIPWVVFQGKADEAEKFAIYEMAFRDVLNLIKEK